MDIACQGSIKGFHGDQGLMGVIVWYKKTLEASSFILFALKIVSTVGSCLMAVISGRKRRKWPELWRALDGWLKSEFTGNIIGNTGLINNPRGTRVIFKNQISDYEYVQTHIQ